MRVLVDTSVWSEAFRRRARHHGSVVGELAELVQEGRVALMGPIRQELLSGIKEDVQFRALREKLRAFPDLPLDPVDYEEAAACFNRCRTKGIQGSNTDFLICAVAIRHELPIFTTDGDFRHYQRLLPVRLYEGRR